MAKRKPDYTLDVDTNRIVITTYPTQLGKQLAMKIEEVLSEDDVADAFGFGPIKPKKLSGGRWQWRIGSYELGWHFLDEYLLKVYGEMAFFKKHGMHPDYMGADPTLRTPF